MFKFNLSNFKKLKSDKDTTVLRHKDGHEIRIAHSALSPKVRAELHALPMADGGPVAPSPTPTPTTKTKTKTDIGGPRGLYADGEEVTRVSSEGPTAVPGSKIPTSTEAQGRPYMRVSAPNWEAAYGVPNSGGGGKSANKQEEPNEYAEGGKVKMYADSPEPVSSSDTAPTANSSSMQDTPEQIAKDAAAQTPAAQDQPAPAAQAPSNGLSPADQQRLYELYNQHVTGNFAPGAPNNMVGLTIGPDGTLPPGGLQPAAANAAFADLQAEKQDVANTAKAKTNDIIAQNQIRAKFGQAPLPVPGQPNTPPQAPDTGPANLGNTGATQAPDQMGNMLGYNQKGYNLQEQGIQGTANVAQQFGNTSAALEGQQAANLQNANASYQQQFQNAMQERSNLQEDVRNGYVNANHFLENQSAPQRVSTAIGLILGGMGAGLTGGPNVAAEFLNKQIDRDIAAQKDNLGAKENLLSNNLSQFKNMNDAMLMTRVNINDYYAHMIDQAKAKYTSQNAQNIADQAKGELMQKNAMLLSMVGSPGSATGAFPGSPGSDIQSTQNYINLLHMNGDPQSMAKAAEIQSRVVPNVGVAAVPVPNEIRDQITARQTFGKQIQRIEQFQHTYGGSLEGIADPAVRAQGEALAKQTQDLYRQANSQGVFKPAEAQFVNGVISGSPSSLFSRWTSLPGYKEAATLNQSELSNMYNQVGLRPQGAPKAGASSAASNFSFKPKGK